MSGIFGIVHLDGSPASTQELESMRSAMQEWGPDAGGTWVQGPAGLGSLISFDTPEAVHEEPPLQSDKGFVLAAEARLDNRQELLAELGVPSARHAELADGALILRAYGKWGAATPSHLLGDWSFSAWHPSENRLFLARDHFGNTGLYYFQDDKRFAFASSRKALFALGMPRRLNEFFLACVLVSWTAHYGHQTIELDLHRLPPAHTLTLKDGHQHIDEYWRLQDTPELRLKDSTAYADGLLSIYDRAVRDRLRSNGGIGLSLSGGLDSGSTAMLAARALAERAQRLRAYTSVPLHDVDHANTSRSFGDEWSLASATARTANNIDLVAVQARDLTPLEGIRATLAIHAEPGHAASNAFWIRVLLSTARRDGVNTLLTGQGGNATVSWHGVDHAGMARRLLVHGHVKRALQIMVYPLLPLGFIRGFRRILHPGDLDWSRTSINLEFARRIDLASEYIRHSGDITKLEDWYPPRQQRFAIIRPGVSLVGTIWAENSAASGLDIRDATFDRRVMEFAVSIPDREFHGPDGIDRWVLRLAMQGVLPDEVRLNRRIGMQAADVSHRLLASAAEVDHVLDDLDASVLAPKYLDLARMRRVWQSLKQGVDAQTSHATVTILTRGMMAGMHLLDRERLG